MKQLYLEKSIGIDFQKDKVIVVLLGKTFRRLDLLDYSIWENNSKETEESDKQLKDNFNNFIKRNKLSNIRGSFCFSRHNIFLKFVDIPAPKKEDIKDILEYEIEKHIPINKEEIYFDFQIVKQKKDNLYSILIAASKKSLVDHYIGLLNESSIMTSLVSLSTVSNFNLLCFNDYEQDIFTAIIEISSGSFNISFILNNTVVYIRNITIPEKLNGLKIHLEKGLSDSELDVAVSSFSEFLIREINISLASYREIPPNKAIDCFYLSGGGLLAKPLKKHLEQKFAWTVRILDPLTKFSSNGISEIDKSCLANAIGTGVQNHIKSNFCINFLPESLRKHAQDHSSKTMLILSGIFMLTLLAMVFGIILKENKTLNKIENELNKIKKEVIVVENMESEYERIRKQKLTIQKILSENPNKLAILKELTSLLPSDLWLTNLAIKQDAVEITGSADTTSKLIPLLEQSDIFTDVHFISSIKRIKNRENFKMKLPLKKMTKK